MTLRLHRHASFRWTNGIAILTEGSVLCQHLLYIVQSMEAERLTLHRKQIVSTLSRLLPGSSLASWGFESNECSACYKVFGKRRCTPYISHIPRKFPGLVSNYIITQCITSQDVENQEGVSDMIYIPREYFAVGGRPQLMSTSTCGGRSQLGLYTHILDIWQHKKRGLPVHRVNYN